MPPSDNQAYSTHLNYIRCLANLVSSSSLTYAPHLRYGTLPDLNRKDQLINLTTQSLNDERAIVLIDRDYSYASTSWLPIKTYYLIFNVLLSVQYVVLRQVSAFTMSHSGCIDEFTRKLEVHEIQFSDPVLNEVFDGTILSYRLPAGANLSGRTAPASMYKLAMKKIANYKLDEWKRRNNIRPRFRSHQQRCQAYIDNNLKISIFDFPYYMRLRSNYRDFAFIEGVSSSDTAIYFNEYFRFSEQLNRCLEEMKSAMVLQRQT